VIRKHPHVYVDVSANVYRTWQVYHGLRLAAEWNVLGRLAFGSDYPVATPAKTFEGTLAVNRVVAGTCLPPVLRMPYAPRWNATRWRSTERRSRMCRASSDE